MNRIAAFDYIRAVSLLGILFCHSCFDSSNFSVIGLGRYLGSTFNFLFLILSAFLLGLSWKHQRYAAYDFRTLGKRIKKLSKSYYPYLVMLFAFLYLSQDYFSWKNIISHTLYLPWFDKIDGFGHLWFLTMIVICYAACWVLSKIPAIYGRRSVLIFCVLIWGGVSDYLLDSNGLPGYIVPYLIGYLLVFRFASEILMQISKLPIAYNIVQVIFINLISIFFFIRGIFDTNHFLSYFLGMFSALSIFCLLYGIFRNSNRTEIIERISGISFEIYLAHEFFLGRYSVYNIFDNPIIGFILLVLLSTITAIVIKSIWPITSKSVGYIFPGKFIDKYFS